MILRLLSDPTTLVISAVIMIFALMFHNVVQAWMASRYGDPNPRLSGFMTFEPQQHLEPIGVLFLFLLGFGWPRKVTVNSRNYRGRGRQEALVWYSGPVAYLIIGFLCTLAGAIFLTVGNVDLFRSFRITASFATIHAIINLFPVLPLDGAYALLALGNPSAKRFMAEINRFGILGFIVFFLALSLLGVIGRLQMLFEGLFDLIIGLIPGLL